MLIWLQEKEKVQKKIEKDLYAPRLKLEDLLRLLFLGQKSYQT